MDFSDRTNIITLNLIFENFELLSSFVLGYTQGRYLAIARRGKEAANERRSCPATHVHHKVVVANKKLACFILCHRDVLCLYSFFFGTTGVWVSNWGGFTYI